MRFFWAGRRKNWMDAQPKRMSSSAVLLENEAGELLIVKANYKEYWALPGGIIEADETPRQAAVRETREEIGVTLNPDELTFVLVVDRMSGSAQTYQFVFKASLPTDQIKLQKSELDEFTFVSKDQVLSSDRSYAKVIQNWAHNQDGYVEQAFDQDKEGIE